MSPVQTLYKHPILHSGPQKQRSQKFLKTAVQRPPRAWTRPCMRKGGGGHVPDPAEYVPAHLRWCMGKQRPRNPESGGGEGIARQIFTKMSSPRKCSSPRFGPRRRKGRRSSAGRPNVECGAHRSGPGPGTGASWGHRRHPHLKQRARVFPCFSCIFHDETTGTVTPRVGGGSKGGGGALPTVVSCS